jgi:hypothetical protein
MPQREQLQMHSVLQGYAERGTIHHARRRRLLLQIMLAGGDLQTVSVWGEGPMNETATQLPLSRMQAAILSALSSTEDLSPKLIASLTGFRESYIKKTLPKLVDGGYVKRTGYGLYRRARVPSREEYPAAESTHPARVPSPTEYPPKQEYPVVKSTQSEEYPSRVPTIEEYPVTATQEPCYCCKHTDYWLSVYGVRVCRVCHPPVDGAEVTQ